MSEERNPSVPHTHDWLQRQIALAKEEATTWPAWKRKAYGEALAILSIEQCEARS